MGLIFSKEKIDLQDWSGLVKNVRKPKKGQKFCRKDKEVKM